MTTRMTRFPLKRRTLLAGATAALLAGMAPAMAQTTDDPAAWGWPGPYEKVSDKSVQWLKDKLVADPGRIPGAVVGPEHGQRRHGPHGTDDQARRGSQVDRLRIRPRHQRGADLRPLPGRSGGNFPFTTLVDRKIPVKSIAIESPNLLHALVVPNDSPIKSIKDLKGMNPPATIGLVTGSSGEFYFQMAAKLNGLDIGKDVILKNMAPGEQMSLPKGITGVVSWDPTPTMMVEERKNGRIVDSIFPYNIYEGTFYLRSEMIENAPDVAQAFSDAFAEATLWTRQNPEKAAALLGEDASLKNYSKEILLQQVKAYTLLYKPTHIFPDGTFYGKANEPIYKCSTRRNASRGRSPLPISRRQWTTASCARPSTSSAGRCPSSRPSCPPAGAASRRRRRTRSTRAC